MDVQRVIDDAVAATPRVRWSVAVTGSVVAGHEPDRQLRTASIGKILLLLEAARQIEERTLDPAQLLPRDPELAIADPGLWQHLTVGALPVADVAVLVAAVSDNFATNVLLERVGLAAVAGLTERLGLRQTSLNDRVRGSRAPGDPRTLSNGSARELADLMAAVQRRQVVSAAVSTRLDGWLATNTDLSMVAAGLHLDPLAHVEPDRGQRLRNKTGSDDGIRADVGYLNDTIAYAVLANWDAKADDPTDDPTDDVLAAMRAIGSALARAARPEIRPGRDDRSDGSGQTAL